MKLRLSVDFTCKYINNSQKVRRMTEEWVNDSIFCPNCGNKIIHFANNKPVADFFCRYCSEEYELKAKKFYLGNKVVDGAWSTMLERLSANNNPNFFFLTYDAENYSVKNFLTIPKYFFIPNIIEKRKPLKQTARRAGWIGCNILLNGIPEFGKIYYVQNGIEKSKNEVLEKWEKTIIVKTTHEIDAKGWLLDILLCSESLKKKQFSLNEMYGFEELLKSKHPLNNNVKAKIRQQLQFLRDKQVIDFIKPGVYRLRD